MAINCPKCKTRTPLSAEELGPAGRFVTCPRCGTTWLARRFAADVYGPQALPATLPPPRVPLTIEGELVVGPRPSPRPAASPAAKRPVAGRPAGPAARVSAAAGWAGAAMLGAALLAVVLLTPAVSALPFFGGGHAGPVALRSVESRTLMLRGSGALLVEGVLHNESDSEAEVPGVRIALRSADAEVYAWVMEPSRRTVAPGASIGFRSALADPPDGVDRISVTLADRADIAGSR